MKLSITSLPLARVKSPVWLRAMTRLAWPAIASSKPCLRLIAGVEPTVPCSSTIVAVSITHLGDEPLASDAALEYAGPMQRRQIKVLCPTGRRRGRAAPPGSRPPSLRRARLPAGRDDRREEDRVDALGDEGPRMALIWFSCFCCASANLRSMPRASACCLVTDVSAARQPDSEPIWLKPMVSPCRFSCAMLTEVKAVAKLAAMASLEIMVTMSSQCGRRGVFTCDD
jgi:hypothetical protein